MSHLQPQSANPPDLLSQTIIITNEGKQDVVRWPREGNLSPADDCSGGLTDILINIGTTNIYWEYSATTLLRGWRVGGCLGIPAVRCLIC